jgi:hypothetical protein
MPVIPDEAQRRSGIQNGSGGIWIALTLHCVPRLRGNDAKRMVNLRFVDNRVKFKIYRFSVK